MVSLSAVAPLSSRAQAAGYRAEVVRIDPADRQLTLKASMGQLTVRVVPGVALDEFKPGDRVLVTFGQDGTETVITHIERAPS